MRNDKEKDKEYYAKYYLINQVKINNYKKKYYEDHKEFYSNYTKKYRQENLAIIKEKQKEKMTCICGKIICKRTLNKHLLTNKHKEKTTLS